jgi:hypothetical protein
VNVKARKELQVMQSVIPTSNWDSLHGLSWHISSLVGCNGEVFSLQMGHKTGFEGKATGQLYIYKYEEEL